MSFNYDLFSPYEIPHHRKVMHLKNNPGKTLLCVEYSQEPEAIEKIFNDLGIAFEWRPDILLSSVTNTITISSDDVSLLKLAGNKVDGGYGLKNNFDPPQVNIWIALVG